MRLIERRPVARLRGPEALWWVDATGMPFAPEAVAADGDADASLDALPLLVTERAVAAGVRSAVLASAIGQIGQLAAAGLAVSEWHLERRVADDHQPAALARLRGSIPPLLLGEGDRGSQIHTLARALAIGQVSDAGLIDLRFRNQVIFWPVRPGIGTAGKRAPPEG